MNVNELVVLQGEQVSIENDKLVFSIELEEQQGNLSYDLELNELEIVIPNEESITEFDITDDEMYEILDLLEEYSHDEYGLGLGELHSSLTSVFF
jgi:hypothetical protein